MSPKEKYEFLKRVIAGKPDSWYRQQSGYDVQPVNNSYSGQNGNSQQPIDTTYSDVLSAATQQGQSDDPLVNLLNSLGIQQTGGLTGSQRDDWNKQLLDTLTNYFLELNKREYNEKLQAEQRQFDLPSAQLARLMATGIGRDQAISLLGGSAAGGSAAGVPYTQGVSAADGIAPSQSKLNDVQAVTGIANTVVGAIGCVSSLVQLGFSIPNAIAQTALAKSQAFLTQRQSDALMSIDAITAGANAAINAGVISQDQIDGLQNASQYEKFLRDNSVTLQPYISQQVFDSVFNSSIGRDLFVSDFKRRREGQTEGTLIDSFVKSQQLQNDLRELDKNQSLLDYNLALEVFDDQVQLFHQQVLNGDLTIELNGQRVDIGEYDVLRANTEKEIYNDFMNGDPTGQGQASGKHFLSVKSWYDLLDASYRSSIPYQSHNQGVYEDLLQKNFDLTYNVALVKWMMSQNLEDAWNDDKSPFISKIMRFGALFKDSGLSDAIKLVNNNGESTTDKAGAAAAIIRMFPK